MKIIAKGINKITAVVGAGFAGLGAAGAFGLCHAACMAIIAGLAMVGITITGMPLAFLQDAYPIFIAIGLGFIGLSVYLYFRHKNGCMASAKKIAQKRKIAKKSETNGKGKIGKIKIKKKA